MKHIICIILFLFSSFIYSQELECCKTIDEVNKFIVGEWKEKNVKTNISYKFWFENKIGMIDILIELDGINEELNDEKNTLFGKNTTFEIEKNEIGFVFVRNELTGGIEMELTQLTEEILVIDGIEFVRRYN